MQICNEIIKFFALSHLTRLKDKSEILIVCDFRCVFQHQPNEPRSGWLLWHHRACSIKVSELSWPVWLQFVCSLIRVRPVWEIWQAFIYSLRTVLRRVRTVGVGIPTILTHKNLNNRPIWRITLAKFILDWVEWLQMVVTDGWGDHVSDHVFSTCGLQVEFRCQRHADGNHLVVDHHESCVSVSLC